MPGRSAGAGQEPVPVGSAQESRRVTVRVRQVAGANVYLDVGTAQGVVTGDTLEVARDSLGPVEGRVHVVASTDVRSVLVWLGDPLPVRAGDPLTLVLSRPATAPVPPRARAAAAARMATTATDASLSPTRGRTPAHGRWAMEVSALRSTTRAGGQEGPVARTFATPAFRLDATVPDAAGGFRLRTSLRLAYRYSDRTFRGEALSTRVYVAALERDFTSVPLQLTMGRFYGPAGSLSGYWDGLHARLGRSGLGVNVLLGFEPDLWNEAPSTEVPKVGLVVDWERRGDLWRWSGDLSARADRPRSTERPDRTAVGLGQSLRSGAVRLDQDLEIDRTPTGRWEVARLRLQGVLSITPRLDLRAGFNRRRTGFVLLADEDFPLHDRISLGLAAQAGGGWLALDLARNRRERASETRGATLSFASGRLGILGGAGLTGAASLWDGEDGSTFTFVPGASIRTGIVRLRIGYVLHRAVYLQRTTTTHGGDLTVDLPMERALSATLSVGGRWGSGLASQRAQLTLSRTF